MEERRKTSRWAWFLFKSGLPTARAKQLLAEWSEQDLALEQVLKRLPAGAPKLGLTPTEAGQLASRGEMPVTALSWDDARYPQGLLSLPLKLRPALLFYDGEPTLLDRTIVYLPPAELASEEDREIVRETISLVLGEHLLLGVYENSKQAMVLFEEMTYTEGEALLFASAGLGSRSPTGLERALVDAGRLIVVSPLAPEVAHRHAWEPVLRQVAATAADRLLLTGEAARHPTAVVGLECQPTLAISDEVPSTPLPDNVQSTRMPADALLWLDSLLADAVDLELELGDLRIESEGVSSAPAEAERLTEADLGPPPSPQEILSILESGGKIPEALRRRLLGEDKDT
ncbi:MAG: hypothetical protein ACP5JG_07220 [Anaerolineae bacterium]